MVNVMATSAIKVRSKPLVRKNSRRILGPWTLLIAAFVLVAAFVVGYETYSGRLGIIGPQPLIVDNGPARIIKVPPGGNVQAAIERAKGGDIVELQAGARYSGTINLPNKPLTDFVTIQTSAVAALPADKRVSPSQRSSMATINPGILTRPAILAENGAHHYRFVGIEFGPTTKGYFNIIQIGTGDENSVSDLPHHIEFDRVYLHGDSKFGQRRGIAANGRNIKIANSYFSDFKREGEESQAIAMWASDGPVEIVNNYLEAASQSILFGGAESKLGLIPSNSIVRDNWLNKPVEWREKKWLVKNMFEIKSGRHIKVENNLMTNNWLMGQDGSGVLFTTREDSGKNAVIEDIDFVGNIVRGTASAVNVYGAEVGGGRRLNIRNNVFEDISSKNWGGDGFFLKLTAWQDLVIENNTIIQDGNITTAYGKPISGFVFRNNIVFNNSYGFFGDDAGSGRGAIARYFPQSVITNNVIVGADSREYGDSNFYPVSAERIGFSNSLGGDYRLSGSSPYLKKNIGADLDPKTVGGK